MIEVKVEADAVRAALARLVAASTHMQPVMHALAEDMLDAVQQNFMAEGRPKWKALQPRSIKRGRSPAMILHDTGDLVKSIVTYSDATQAVVGTNKHYAAIHQFGGKTRPHVIRPKKGKALMWPGARHPVKAVNHPGSNIPARPFLSLTAADEARLVSTVSTYLRGLIP
jgi:phage virion morphogenesis protein